MSDEMAAKAREAETMLPEVGSKWMWEPLDRHATETVIVTEVKWNGEEWWIESEGTSGRHWNVASRWVEATVFLKPAPE
jgi:hypothetical protein